MHTSGVYNVDTWECGWLILMIILLGVNNILLYYDGHTKKVPDLAGK